MGNVRELYIREHYVIREIRENFVSRKFPSARYKMEENGSSLGTQDFFYQYGMQLNVSDFL